MRTLILSNTAVDLQAQASPFNPGATMVALNLAAGSLVIQESDDEAFTTPVTVATVLTNTAQEITPVKQYLRVSTSANVQIFGN